MKEEKEHQDKYYCHECKKMVVHDKFKVSSKEGVYIKRDGRLPICDDCNRDLGVIKRAVKDGKEKTMAEIERYERIISLKHIALQKIIEKEGGGVLKVSN